MSSVISAFFPVWGSCHYNQKLTSCFPFTIFFISFRRSIKSFLWDCFYSLLIFDRNYQSAFLPFAFVLKLPNFYLSVCVFITSIFSRQSLINFFPSALFPKSSTVFEFILSIFPSNPSEITFSGWLSFSHRN